MYICNTEEGTTLAKQAKKKPVEPKRIVVSVPDDLHEAFLKTCHDLDTTGAQEVRRFMRAYVQKNSQMRLL